MARGEHHRIHAADRLQRNRLRIAQEAARLMTEHGIRDYHHAKTKAAERLGVMEAQALPRNQEIEQALREHQRLFQADTQPQRLRRYRQAAVEAMHFLDPWQPRLVGAVMDGTADAHSAVCLHLFSDDPDAVLRFLQDRQVPYQMQTRQLRTSREETADYTVLLFAADGVPFDLTLMPGEALRQAPLDRVDGKPMRRMNLPGVEQLVAQDEADGDEGFEQRLAAALR